MSTQLTHDLAEARQYKDGAAVVEAHERHAQRVKVSENLVNHPAVNAALRPAVILSALDWERKWHGEENWQPCTFTDVKRALDGHLECYLQDLANGKAVPLTWATYRKA